MVLDSERESNGLGYCYAERLNILPESQVHPVSLQYEQDLRINFKQPRVRLSIANADIR